MKYNRKIKFIYRRVILNQLFTIYKLISVRSVVRYKLYYIRGIWDWYFQFNFTIISNKINNI